MTKKINELLNSVRFWIVTITAGVALLRVYGIINDEVQNIVLAWASAVVGIGTIDKILTKK